MSARKFSAGNIKVWQVVAVGLVLVLAFALGINSRENAQGDNSSSNQQEQSQTANANTKSNVEEVDYVRIVDGDTIVVKQKGLERKVRLVGVDTPESVSSDASKNCEEGKMASAHTEKILTGKTKLWISKDQSDTDTYGRLLRFVWLEKPTEQPSIDEIKSKMLNAVLLQDGYAQAVDYNPDTTLSTLFHQLGDEASSKDLGVTYKWKG